MSVNVLVVEDEALVADDIQRTLTRLGYNAPLTVASARDAIDAAGAMSGRPDIVLMDIKLRGAMDGIEAARCIRREFKTPVVFLTSHSDDATLARAKEVGPQGYLLKPFDDRELRTAIEVGMHNHGLEMENERLYGVAQRAIKARDSVLQIVAHDLRNPLNALLLHTAGLMRRGETERRDQRPVQAIRAAAWRMNRLINDLLDVARLDAGEPLSIVRSCVAARTVIAAVTQGQARIAARSSVTLGIDVSSDLPEVWADPARLEQVFENLIGNAIKFTPPGGSITVGATRSDGAVLFFVRDTGSGINPDEAPHLFERFWQSDKSDRRGAGLGLAIVKGIVESLAGRAWAESRLGEGTTIFFSLPTILPSDSRADIVRAASAPCHPQP